MILRLLLLNHIVVNGLVVESYHGHDYCGTVEKKVQQLSRHPMVCWDETTSLQKARKKLQPRHKGFFNSTIGSTSSSSSPSEQESFSSFALFDKFSRVLCDTCVIPRKELMETWAAALYIHSRFLNKEFSSCSTNHGATTPETTTTIRRVCDVAAGHGLLAWALLVLDEEDECYDDSDSEGERRRNPLQGTATSPLTALCVDRKMPSSAEIIQTAMVRQWPQLEDRFDYVEGWLEQLRPHPSCLLVSVHACGGLSDTIVSSSVYNGAPLALVPCCHSRKKKALLGAPVEYAPVEYNGIVATTFSKGSKPLLDLAKQLDEAREAALRNAGFTVTTAFLPKLFTHKNRLIMASPPTTIAAPPLQETDEKKNQTTTLLSTSATELPNHPRGKMPPLFFDNNDNNNRNVKSDHKKDNNNHHSRMYHLEKFFIPCEDTAESRMEIKRQLSGRRNANRRAHARHRKNNAPSPEFDISIWLPPLSSSSMSQNNNNDIEQVRRESGVVPVVVITEKALSDLASSISSSKVKCVAVKHGEEFVHSSGRRAQTFRLAYSYYHQHNDQGAVRNDDMLLLTDQDAKAIHERLYDHVPTTFPGAQCR